LIHREFISSKIPELRGPTNSRGQFSLQGPAPADHGVPALFERSTGKVMSLIGDYVTPARDFGMSTARRALRSSTVSAMNTLATMPEPNTQQDSLSGEALGTTVWPSVSKAEMVSQVSPPSVAPSVSGLLPQTEAFSVPFVRNTSSRALALRN